MGTGKGERPHNERNDLDAVYSLISAMDPEHPYTSSHQSRVNDYAVALAGAIGLSPDQVGIVGVAALLHDIGKIGIPDGVLMKKDKLSEEDWKAIRAHPKLGAEIVRNAGKIKLSDEDSKAFQTASQSLWASMLRNAETGRVNVADCADIILHHHERWDGTGYPEGLKGEDIPLGARIIGIAESFGAMISDRPHRPALFIEEAIAEIRQGAGSRFDPGLVDAFLHKFEYKTSPELREKYSTAMQSLPTHAERIRTALQSLPNWHSIDPGLIRWSGSHLGVASCFLSVEDDPSAVRRTSMYYLDKETTEYDQEALRWLRYRQARSKAIDEIIKRKDELARSIKEGKVDADRLFASAAKGDVDSLNIMLPYFEFDYQTRPPSLGEKFTDFLLRR